MPQHPDPHEDEDDLEAFGTPFYQGSGLSVRALTAEELQRFLDAHADQPAELLGRGWTAPDPPGHPYRRPRTVLWAEREPLGPLPAAAAEPDAACLGSPGRSALAAYRRRRASELAAWTRSLAWRAPLVAAAGVAGQVLAAQAGLSGAGPVGLVVAILVGWRLRFRPSEQARTWQRGAAGERRTARLLRRLLRDGYIVFHDLALPGSDANVDHLLLGPSGVFVIDSKQWTGQVHQSADGLAWHNHYPLDRTLATVRWEAEAISHLLGSHAAAVLCVHGARIDRGGLHAGGVAIVPAGRLRDALGHDRVLSDNDIELLAATICMQLRPAT
jgi:hypothetical protein